MLGWPEVAVITTVVTGLIAIVFKYIPIGGADKDGTSDHSSGGLQRDIKILNESYGRLEREISSIRAETAGNLQRIDARIENLTQLLIKSLASRRREIDD